MRKKIYLLALFIFAFLINVNVVKGYSFHKEQAEKFFHPTGANVVDQLSVEYGLKTYYHDIKVDGISQVAFCLDPASLANEGTMVEVEDYPENVKAALTAMLQNSLSDEIENSNYNVYTHKTVFNTEISIPSDDYYSAVTIAVRQMSMLMNGNTKKSTNMRLAAAHVTSGLSYIQYLYNNSNGESFIDLEGNSVTYKDAIEKFEKTEGYNIGFNSIKDGKLKTDFADGQGWYGNSEEGTGSFRIEYTNNSVVESVVNDLMLRGIEAMYEYMQDDTSGPSVTKTTRLSTENNLGTIVLDFNNFSTSSTLDSLKLDFQNNSTVQPIKYEYKVIPVDGEPITYNDINSIIGINLEKVDKIEVIITVEHDDNCDPLSYILKYSYSDPKLSSKLYVLRASKEASQNQDIITLIENPGSEEEDTSGSFMFCGDACETTSTIPNVCTEITGLDPNYDIIEYEVTGPTDITKCILDHVDTAGNSYSVGICEDEYDNGMESVVKTNNENFGFLDTSDDIKKSFVDETINYCTVSCKEDYNPIKFPGIQHTYSGAYFTIEAQLTGVKTCYTNEIDKEQFTADVVKYQKQMIDAYNTYAEYDAAVITSSGFAPNTTWHLGNDTRNSKVYEHQYYQETNGQLRLKTTEEEKVERLESEDSKSEIESIKKEEMMIAESLIEIANENLKKAIAAYQSCSGDIFYTGDDLNTWEMSFPYEPEIEYTYDDPYNDLISDENSMMQLYKYDENIEDDIELWACDGSVNNEYDECNGTIYDDEGYTEESSFTECTTKGCDLFIEPISSASYVKQTVTKEMNYITPRVFYNESGSGKIIYSEDGSNPSNENTGIQANVVNGLPTHNDPDSNGDGLYNFKYTLSNLGEYYDTCEAGRLDEVLDNQGFGGEYICHIIPDCPDCEFDIDLEIPDKDDCPNCAFKLGISDLFFRTISTENFNPNNRPLGPNWNYVITDTFGFINGKAHETLYGDTPKVDSDTKLPTVQDNEGIIGTGENVYDQEPIMSVSLTPGLANEIRRSYNDNDDVVGGYINDSITCYDYVYDGITYNDVFCYSEFIDYLLEDHKDLVMVSVTRPNSENERKSNSTDYFGVFTDGLKAPSESVIGGPSWTLGAVR